MGLNHPTFWYTAPALPREPPGLMSPPERALGALAKLDPYRNDRRDTAEEDGAAPASGEEGPPSGDTARILDAVSLCQTTLTSKIGEG